MTELLSEGARELQMTVTKVVLPFGFAAVRDRR
jgi:hypothetical protein